MILEGSPDQLAAFAATSRFRATDPKGDTALHLVARAGNLLACDILVRAGANLRVTNHDGQTPADVAMREGHGLIGRLLSSIAPGPAIRGGEPPGSGPVGEELGVLVSDGPDDERRVDSESASDDFLDLPEFEPEESPAAFDASESIAPAAGVFLPLSSRSPESLGQADVEWEIDLSPAWISGEGLGPAASVQVDQGADDDFLKTRKTGPRPRRPAVLQTGTRISVDPARCRSAARRMLRQAGFTLGDIEDLVASCRGNADPADLSATLRRTLEAAGLECRDEMGVLADVWWESRTDVSADDLADAILAALTRSTRLPGTGRFLVDKSDERRLIDPPVRVRQELRVRILSDTGAVGRILGAVDEVRDGARDRASVTLSSISPARQMQSETDHFIAAAGRLADWHANGRVMDGKRWREALAALEALDLSLSFLREVAGSAATEGTANGTTASLADLTAALDAATWRLIDAHIPYVRRFASRNVETGEDPEDVFQVAFTGLHRATRRFDPERGVRFIVYGAFWMKQTLMRWRTDEGAIIRIPAHRAEDLAKFGRVLDRLEGKPGGIITDDDLVLELGWTPAKVDTFRRIPFRQESVDESEGWERLIPGMADASALEAAQLEKLVAAAIAGLEERQASIVRMRFGIGDGEEKTLEEIGQLYGVTRERIRQIEAKALRTLGHPSSLRRLAYLLGD